MERPRLDLNVRSSIEDEIATSRSADLFQIFTKQRFILKKEREYLRDLQHTVSSRKTLARVDTITDFNPLTNTYFRGLEPPPPAVPKTAEKRKLNRSVSVAVGDVASYRKLEEKQKDRNPKPRLSKKLERTQSEPFIHSWEFNNIDITNELVLPKHVFNGTMQVYLAQRWREKRLRLSFSAATLKEHMAQFDINDRNQQDDEVPSDVRDMLKEEQKNRQVKIMFETNKEGKQVVAAGSASDLLSSLIDKEYIDSNFIELFLYSHDYWISSAELMKALTNYYRKPIKDSADPKAKHNEVIAFVIKKRIVLLLQLWLEDYIYEIKDPDTVQPLNQFIKELEQSKNEAEKKWSEMLMKSWTHAMKKAHEFSIYCRPTADLAEEKKKLYKKNPAKLSFLDINPSELAKQLTLFDYQIIGRIAPNEFFICNRKSGRSPNVAALIDRNHRLTMWVATEILTTANDKQRAIVVGNFIQLMTNLMELRNYQSFLNIYFGLKRPQVARLKKTWSLLSSKLRQRWEEFDSVITLQGLIDFFDRTLSEPLPKVLPSQLFLRYIAIQEQEPEFYEKDNKLLNFIKLRGLGLIVKYIRHSQVGLFPFEEVDYLQAYLRNHMQHLEEEQLIKLSHGIERKQVNHRKSVLVVPESNGVNILTQSLNQHVTNMINTVVLTPRDTLVKQIHNEMLTKWNRPYTKCSIAADLPRLVTKIQIVDEQGQIMIIRNFFQGKSLKKNAARPQPQSVKEYIHIVLGICANKMNLTKEAAAIKIRFDEYFNPPKWQSSASPREKPLSTSAEVKKTTPSVTLGTSPGRSAGFAVPRSGSSPELDSSPRLSNSPPAPTTAASESGSASRRRISIGRVPQTSNTPSIDVSSHSPRSTSMMNLSKDSEEQDLNKTLDRFIKEVLGEGNPLVTLLKSGASQGVLSPAWVRLKLFLLVDFPFKDVKDKGWIIVIEFSSTEVRVIHKKKERSADETEAGTPDFEFCWELILVFPLTMDRLIRTHFVISSFHVADSMPKAQQGDFKTIMDQYKGQGYKRNKKKKKVKHISMNM